MAQKVQVELIDDLDGSKAVKTVTFSINGVDYEIDLSEANLEAFESNFDYYTAAARRTGAKPRKAAPAPVDREQNQAIRDWALRNGHKVAERGRIPAGVIQAYHQAA